MNLLDYATETIRFIEDLCEKNPYASTVNRAIHLSKLDEIRRQLYKYGFRFEVADCKNAADYAILRIENPYYKQHVIDEYFE